MLELIRYCHIFHPSRDTVTIAADDLLLVKGSASDLVKILHHDEVELPQSEEGLSFGVGQKESIVVELIIMICALTAAFLMILSGCLQLRNAYRSIQADVLLFIISASPKQAHITAAWRTILNSWKLSGFQLVEPTARRGRVLSEPIWLLAPICDGCHPALFGLRLAEPAPWRENLARYIIRASFSQECMTYIGAQDSSDGVAKVIYQSKSLSSTRIGEC